MSLAALGEFPEWMMIAMPSILLFVALAVPALSRHPVYWYCKPTRFHQDNSNLLLSSPHLVVLVALHQEARESSRDVVTAGAI